jgi:predicted nucleic acid-binding protein
LSSEAERIVVDTGPLIALGRVGALDVVGRLPLAFVIPKEVADEIEIGARAGYPVAVPAWAAVLPLGSTIVSLGPHLLDAGEAAVIQLAIEQGINDVCIDEWRGRPAATSVGLKVTGSLGLLGRAKRIGLIEAVRPWVERLTACGVHYHPELVGRFLREIGE